MAEFKKCEVKKEARLGCTMLQALYEFRATLAKTLSFQEKEMFVLFPANKKQKQWWQVVNRKAQVGFIPSNYVTTLQVSPATLLEFLCAVDAILSSEREAAAGKLPQDRQDLASHVANMRQAAEEEWRRGVTTPEGNTPKQAPPPPTDFSPDRAGSVVGTPASTPGVPVGAVPAVGGLAVAGAVVAARLGVAPATPKTKTVSPQVPRRHSSLDEGGRRIVHAPPAATPNAVTSNGLGPWPDVTPAQAYHLLQEVRRHTGLSFDSSRIAASVALSEIVSLLGGPAVAANVCPPLGTVLHMLLTPSLLKVPKTLLETSLDAQRLRVILSEMAGCQADQQQRSWALYEDRDIINDYLDELTSILTKADPEMCQCVLAENQYSDVVSMTLFYQMELRWDIRSKILDALQAMCVLDALIVSILVASVVPMELARDMMANPQDIPRLTKSASLLTTIFSMGEPLPVTHLEHISRKFISFLLAIIEGERPPSTNGTAHALGGRAPQGDSTSAVGSNGAGQPRTDLETDEAADQLSDVVFRLVLAYNLQWRAGTTCEAMANEALEALACRSTAKIFVQKLLLLVNREEDPVRVLKHEPAPPHAALKMCTDLIGRENTAALLYTNDARVLLDIALRRLTDLAAGDMRRRTYLEICRLVMRNTPYSDHEYRREDLLKCFTRIFCEESEASVSDQTLVREISNEFPQYFKC